MAERAGWVSAAISGIALVISVASYIDSSKADKRSAKASLPVIQISSLRLMARAAFNQKLQPELDLHNFGLNIAKEVEVTYQYYVDPLGSRFVKQDAISGALFGVGDVAQGSSRLVTLSEGNMLWKPDRESAQETLLIYGWLRYRTEQGQEPIAEPWCFVTRFAEAVKSAPTTLYSCDSVFHSDLRDLPGGARLAPDDKSVSGGALPH